MISVMLFSMLAFMVAKLGRASVFVSRNDSASARRMPVPNASPFAGFQRKCVILWGSSVLLP